MRDGRDRVIVVGAGLSGLAAAYRLDRAGVDVLVFEARRRVGGRAWRLPLSDGHFFDAGCEALDDAHSALLRLAGELGVATWRGEAWGSHLQPPLTGDDLGLFRALEAEIHALAARIDPMHPGEVEGAARLDGETLGRWLRDRGASARVLAVAETWYAVSSSGVPIDDMSLLAMAAKVGAGAAPNGLALRLAGGPSALAERLATELGDSVRCGTPVRAIEQDGGGVRVRTAGGARERGARAILALPLTLQRELELDPPPPPHRRRALERARYGAALKAALVVDEDEPTPPALPQPDGVLYRPYPDRPVLAVFAGAGAAQRLAALAPHERRAMLERMACARATAFAAVDWSQEPFSRGAYLIFGPGDLTDWGHRLADVHGRVHFAGSEASPLPSYMNGAVLAGERAAEEVLLAL